MHTGARKAAISLTPAIFTVALPIKLPFQDLEEGYPCYGDFRMLWFSGGNEGIGRCSGDYSDWSKSLQVAYYLVITIQIKKIAKCMAEREGFNPTSNQPGRCA
jgi:hypothetical protein